MREKRMIDAQELKDDLLEFISLEKIKYGHLKAKEEELKKLYDAEFEIIKGKIIGYLESFETKTKVEFSVFQPFTREAFIEIEGCLKIGCTKLAEFEWSFNRTEEKREFQFETFPFYNNSGDLNRALFGSNTKEVKENCKLLVDIYDDLEILKEINISKVEKIHNDNEVFLEYNNWLFISYFLIILLYFLVILKIKVST